MHTIHLLICITIKDHLYLILSLKDYKYFDDFMHLLFHIFSLMNQIHYINEVIFGIFLELIFKEFHLNLLMLCQN